MDKVTRRSLTLGFVALAVVVPLYLTLGPATGRPLAAFAVPPLLTALVGRWRPTLIVGFVSLSAAVVAAVFSPMGGAAVGARLVVNASLIATATVVAHRSEREHEELVELAAASALYHVFESGLLPSPTVPTGYDAVVRFVASQQQMALGGDLVDAVDLPDGRLAFVIGDVCGHGPREAAFATAVRAGWRTVVRTHRPDPSIWLAHLRRTLYPQDHELPYVTMCTGIVDLGTNSVLLAVAGHPPPIVFDGATRPAVLTHGLPVGVDPLSRWPTQRLPIGSGLLLYTDGLVDNPSVDGPAARWGECGLVRWLDGWTGAHGIPVDHDDRVELVDHLVDAARSGRAIDDDLAVLLVSLETSSRDAGAARGSSITTVG